MLQYICGIIIKACNACSICGMIIEACNASVYMLNDN